MLNKPPRRQHPQTSNYTSGPLAAETLKGRHCCISSFHESSELRHSAANLLQQGPRAVPLTPSFDVRPVKLVPLHAHHGANIVLIAAARPADLHYDHILRRWEP